MLPPGPGASEARAAQKSALAGLVHEAATSESLGALLASLQAAAAPGSSAAGALDEWAVANLREASRDFARASAVPKELAQRKAALESSAYAGEFFFLAPFFFSDLSGFFFFPFCSRLKKKKKKKKKSVARGEVEVGL